MIATQQDALIEKLLSEFEKARTRDWDKFYITVDLHDTVLGSTYVGSDISKNFFDRAIPCLQLISKRKDTVLILDTSSNHKDIAKYLTMFSSLGIHFDYVGENPEQKNTSYADFNKKYYFNLRLDDKAGFNPHTHWKLLEETFGNIPLLTGPRRTFKVSATIMRIQSPSGPHEGHMKLISELFERGKEVIIFLACDRSFVSHKNPLGFEERKKLIDLAIAKTSHHDRTYSILPLPNQRFNHVWAHVLDTAITTHTQKPNLAPGDVGLFHSRDGFGKHYFSHGRFPVIEVEEIPGVSATKLRDQVVTHRSITEDFVYGAVAQQMKNPEAVLMIQTRGVIRDENGNIGLIKYKSNSEVAYRFPGGYFSALKDDDFESSLERKLNAKLSYSFTRSEFTYIGNARLTDWRHRETGAKIIAMVYEIQIKGTIDINENPGGPKLLELVFVPHEKLETLVDEEEVSIIPLIKP